MISKSIVLMLIAILLGGCDNICSNKCAPHESHDSFCGCQDYRNIGARTGGGGPIPAACICQYKDGLIGAWFNSQPPGYNNFNSNVSVAAASCALINWCGSLDDSPTYFQGTVSIKPEKWESTTNPSTGSTLWRLFGRQPTQKSDSTGVSQTEFADLQMSFGLKSLQIRRLLVQSKPDNDVNGCTASCNEGNAYCNRVGITGANSNGLVRLASRLSATEAVIEPSELQSIFNTGDGGCGRGATTVKGGNLTNVGSQCTISALLPSTNLIAEITVPPVLEGEYSTAGDKNILDLRSNGSKPQIHFKPRDKNSAIQVENARLIDSDWGGDVKFVYGNTNYIGFSVGNDSCIRVQME